MLPFAFLQSYALLFKVVGVVLALSAAYFSGVHTATVSLTTKHQAETAQQQADAATRVIAAQRETISIQSTWMSRYEGAVNDQIHERSANSKILAGLASGVGGVRSAIDTFATGRDRDAPDTVAACRTDATALGNLLDRALLLAGRRTADAEEHATDLRALRAAWPTDGKSEGP